MNDKVNLEASMAICGLSESEAAKFLRVSVDTVKSWTAGQSPVPANVWKKLCELHTDMIDAARGGVQYEWPCKGTSNVVEAMKRMKLEALE